MRKLTALALFLLTGCASLPAENGEACIGSNLGYETCSFGISVRSATIRHLALVTSQRSTKGITDRLGSWKTLDQIAVPDDASRTLEYGSCRFKGVPSDTIVALLPAYGENDPEFIRAVDWAYNVELPSGKFSPLDPQYVDCVNTAIDSD